jgi:hypothetical protein
MAPMFTDPSEDEQEHIDTLGDIIEYFDFPGFAPRFTLVSVIAMSYVQKLLQTRRGSIVESDPMFGNSVLLNAGRLKEKSVAVMQGITTSKVELELLSRLIQLCDSVIELYSALMIPEYVQKETHARVEILKEDLMRAAWHPSRVQWWMDEELKKDLQL